MLLPPAEAWKLVLAAALFGAVLTSARARPPRRPVPTAELRRLVLGAMALYGVGLSASLSHHHLLAVVLFAGGIATSALAAWLSRGSNRREPPHGEEPAEEPPPPSPEGGLGFDWASFERALEDYGRRGREPVKAP